MPSFGEASRKRLMECHPRLREVLEEAIVNGPDFTILCGHRTEAEQNEAFAAGKSKLKWPQSKHNSLPSRAVDIAPYPIDWNNTNRFRILAGYILGISDALRIKVRWGGDWDRDYNEANEKFRDLPHFELVED